MEESAILFITVLPKVPYKCHYIINDGEENWKDYDDMLLFLQQHAPNLSAQLMELFITHEAFILNVQEMSIDVLTADNEAYELQVKKLMRQSRNPAAAHTESLRIEREKIPFEMRLNIAGQNFLDAIYKKGRDK